MFSFPPFSTSTSQGRGGSAPSGLSADGMQRAWEVDPLNTQEAPALRGLAIVLAMCAGKKTATLYFEPWLKHACSVFLQECDETYEVVPFPYQIASTLQPLISEICQIEGNTEATLREGRGNLVVRGHTFALIAKTEPSPWGQRLLLSATREGDALPDSSSAFQEISGCGLDLCDTIIDLAEVPPSTNHLASVRSRVQECVQLAKRLVMRQPSPPQSRRIELLRGDRHDEECDAYDLIYRELREATGRGTPRIRLLEGYEYIEVYQQGGQYETGWSNNGRRCISRGDTQLGRVIADLGLRYPADVTAEHGAIGIAIAVGGHHLDVTIKETRAQDVSWDGLPLDLAENIPPYAIVFNITIHDDSPEPPHWQRNRKRAEEQQSLGEEPPSELSCSVIVAEQWSELLLPHRSWLGWLRRRLGVMGRAQAGVMTLEDAREVASLVRAKSYEKALARALPFKSSGPEIAMSSGPFCVFGFLELLLGRYREARASIWHYQTHAGEDILSTLLLAECCERLGDTGASQEATRRALEISPESVGALVADGSLLESHGLAKHAALLYELALKLQAIEIHGELALENERRYRPCSQDAHVGLIAWRYAQLAADHMVTEEGIDTYLMPTEYGCALERKTHEHGGLYWHDIEEQEGRRVRRYLPNYVNRFAVQYNPCWTAVTKLGPLLRQLGRSEEAAVFLSEARRA
jgi:hypothetical protein